MLIPPNFETEIEKSTESGILQDVRPSDLAKRLGELDKPSSINLLIVSCCDGHQFLDLIRRTESYLQLARRDLGIPPSVSNDCLHWITQNGGPFVLSVDEIATRKDRDETDNVRLNLRATMRESINLKKLNVVMLIPHGLCAKVRDIPRFQSWRGYEHGAALSKSFSMDELGLETDQVILQIQAHRQKGRRTMHLDYSTYQRQAIAA